MTLRAALAGIFVLGLLGACVTGSGPGVLEQQFRRIAFSTEYGGEARAGRLVRWEEPVRIRINGPVFYQYSLFTDRLINELAGLTGLDIARAEPGQAANLDIRLTTDETLAAIAGSGVPCYTRVVVDEHYNLVRASIFIRSGPADQVQHCLTEEIAQAMGLLDDSPLIPASVFHDGFTGPDLTPADQIMIATLYDPKLKPGMDAATAMPLATAILDGHKRR